MANDNAGRRSGVSAAEDRTESHGDEPRARAAGARKPGVFAKAIEQARSAVESIQLPKLDWKAFAWGLLVLVVLAFVIRNWAPMRISFFGWYFDAPRAVVLVIMFALGMMTAWLLEVRSRRKPDREDEAASEEAEEAKEPQQAESAAAEADEPADEDDLFPEDDYEADEIAFDEPRDEAALPEEDLRDDEQ